MGEDDGGILALLELIEDEERRAFLEYDFRARFQIGVDQLPDVMGWDEAARLVRVLSADPSSAMAAHLAGWDFPISRETLALYDLHDRFVEVHSDPKRGRPKPHPGRPFSRNTSTVQKFGDTAGRSRAEVVEILNGLGHSLPV